MKNKNVIGGLILAKPEPRQMTVVSHGGVLVSRSRFDKYGAAAIRAINGSLHSEIIVVSDEKFSSMTVIEKENYLMAHVTSVI